MATDWNKLIRKALELTGMIEKKDTAVRRKLAVINQSKPRGPVTIILEDMGPKKISAVTAVRKVTNLDLGDALILAEEMLPFPILTNVNQETAELTRDILEAMGARVRLVGSTTPARMPAQPSRQRPEKTLEQPKIGISIPMSVPEPVKEEGDYVVVLENASLLPERVSQILTRLTGWSREEADITVAKLPQPILLGVTEETAFKAQRELQMLGAVVDVLLWADYDKESA
ncbi:MAG: ribosomal protein L7/L12 [Ardenticatenaceae bacterium]|nr:ribosomal protein L7/L12 [Ardenticatenaceae bacterium]MCB9444793.1 ribosomal protein L7/L12 [Ardenticatenaceae bacterium]